VKPADWPTLSQREALSLIDHHPTISLQDLADKLGGIDWTSARERVQRLEHWGLVERTRGRQRSLRITQTGRQYVETLSPSH
jgi:DNA-binding MarR family transcriptional regulator